MTNWQLALEIEHKVQKIITQQEINGWPFDHAKAISHLAYLNKEREEIYERVRPLLVPELVHCKATVTEPFKADGDYIKRVKDHFVGSEDDIPNDCSFVAGPFSPISFEEPDLASRPKLMKQLSRHGWRPLEYTDKGNPRLTEESMEILEGGVGHDLARWFIYSHRQAQIAGWVNALRPDGKLSAIAIPCGTPTARMRHKVVVNVPKAKPKVIFGKQMRELFIASPGYRLVGYDASGLELRLLAHAIGNDEWTRELVEGDAHSVNAAALGVDDREKAKTFIYAYIYGAGDEKISIILGCSVKEAKRAKANFLKSIPGLKKAIDKFKDEAKRGYIVGLDGRKVPCDSDHKALNRYIQSAGAIVMKKSMILVDEALEREGLTLNEVRKVGDFHDESQSEVIDDVKTIELFSEIGVKSIVEAGKFFNLKCPLDGEVKVGSNWSETH